MLADSSLKNTKCADGGVDTTEASKSEREPRKQEMNWVEKVQKDVFFITKKSGYLLTKAAEVEINPELRKLLP